MADVMRHSTEDEKEAYEAMIHRMSVELHQVDRDALLGLAEEMEMHAQGECDEGDGRVNAGYLWDYADRIRYAIGESYDG